MCKKIRERASVVCLGLGLLTAALDGTMFARQSAPESPAVGGVITLDPGTVYQTMRGWEAVTEAAHHEARFASVRGHPARPGRGRGHRSGAAGGARRQ